MEILMDRDNEKNKANSKPNKANLTFFGDFLQSVPSGAGLPR